MVSATGARVTAAVDQILSRTQPEDLEARIMNAHAAQAGITVGTAAPTPEPAAAGSPAGCRSGDDPASHHPGRRTGHAHPAQPGAAPNPQLVTTAGLYPGPCRWVLGWFAGDPEAGGPADLEQADEFAAGPAAVEHFPDLEPHHRRQRWAGAPRVRGAGRVLVVCSAITSVIRSASNCADKVTISAPVICSKACPATSRVNCLSCRVSMMAARS